MAQHATEPTSFLSQWLEASLINVFICEQVGDGQRHGLLSIPSGNESVSQLVNSTTSGKEPIGPRRGSPPQEEGGNYGRGDYLYSPRTCTGRVVWVTRRAFARCLPCQRVQRHSRKGTEAGLKMSGFGSCSRIHQICEAEQTHLPL